MKLLLVAVTSLVIFSAEALAEAEKSYQGGKALWGGSDVDDRGFEERAGDWMKEQGEKLGGKESNGGENNAGESNANESNGNESNSDSEE